MPGELPLAALRVEPSAIPALRSTFDDSLAELRPHLVRLGQEAYIPEPWLGDPVSAEAATAYNASVMDAADGPYAAMVALEAELLRIRDSLQVMEDHYRLTEGENAALWGRL
jgi:alkylhydroperoxidase family enzyme